MISEIILHQRHAPSGLDAPEDQRPTSHVPWRLPAMMVVEYRAAPFADGWRMVGEIQSGVMSYIQRDPRTINQANDRRRISLHGVVDAER
jgi:hypothetical protein